MYRPTCNFLFVLLQTLVNMDGARRPRFDQRVGPITKYLQAKEYMESHSVQKMFESLIASLMLERPENHFKFLDEKLDAIKEIGVENIDWESFIHDLHPSKDPVRNEYVKEIFFLLLAPTK